MKRGIVFGIISFIIAFSFQAIVYAKTYQECGVAAKTGLVFASVIITPVYVMVKAPLAAAGAVVSAMVNFVTMTYADDFAETLALRTVYGDWYITPAVLHGDRKLQYFGQAD